MTSPLWRPISALCDVTNALDSEGAPEEYVARLDEIIDQLVELMLPRLPGLEHDVCPTCGGPLAAPACAQASGAAPGAPQDVTEEET